MAASPFSHRKSLDEQDCRYRASLDVAASRLGDEIAILDLRSNEYFTLNGSGTFLWEMLQSGPQSVDDLVAQLMDSYDVKYPEAKSEVVDFLQEILDEGLIQADDA